MSDKTPTLPQHAADPSLRASELGRIRDAYAYDYSYQSLCFVKDLPSSERFSVRYMAQSAGALAQLKANKALGALATPGLVAELKRAGSVEDFDGVYRSIPAPVARGIWQDDQAFAWQRVAGAVPTLLTGVERIPDHFPVTQQHFARAMGEGESLEAALREGRVSLCDYRVFDGIPCGRYPPTAKDGLRKHLAAPLALFCATPKARGGLAPVAIQCHQRPGRENPIYTPADGERWGLAKLAVQAADANLEGIVVHFGYTHMIVQAFVMAARRRLSPEHPVLTLLAPHFEFTLAANQYAKGTLVVPDGTQDRILCPTLPATLSVLRGCLREVELADLDPEVDAERHGVHRRDALPIHPFRDDGVDVWRATRRWVEAYLSVYYRSDADAAADVELRAMVDEVGSVDGGQLPRLVAGVKTDTVAAVVDLVARVIHRASTYHAAINYNWWDWMGHVPNAPSVCVAPVPRPTEPAGPEALLAALPPMGVVWETLDQIYGVHSIAANRLGEYPDGFADPRVAPALAALRTDLAAVEARIEARNAARPLPYDCLRPSRITASINA